MEFDSEKIVETGIQKNASNPNPAGNSHSWGKSASDQKIGSGNQMNASKKAGKSISYGASESK